MWGHHEKAGICDQTREVSPETNPTGTLTLNFQSSECEKICFCFPGCPVYDVSFLPPTLLPRGEMGGSLALGSITFESIR